MEIKNEIIWKTKELWLGEIEVIFSSIYNPR